MSKIVINRHSSSIPALSLELSIKAPGLTTPLQLSDGDTFVAKLFPLSDHQYLPPLFDKNLKITNRSEGKILLEITIQELLAKGVELEKETGPKEDRYYLIPTYKFIIECKTSQNGNFTITIPEVCVE